jgi:predicted porin
MKKFAILFALFAAMGAAQADVSVFGTMDAGYNSVKAPNTAAATTGFASGGMTTSYIGFKGTEDLGNGTKAIYELSSFLNAGNGAVEGGTTVNTFARSAFAGVAGGFGQVTMGRQSNPSFLPVILFNAYGDSGTYGPLWHATYFGNTGNATTQLYNDTAWDNSIAYETPSIGGAKVTLQNSKGTAGQNFGGNVLFFKGDLGLTAFYQKTGYNSSGSFQTDIYTANPGTQSTERGFGASYDLKVAKLFATYTEGKDAKLNMDGKTTQVSATVPFGPGNVLAEAAHTRYDGGTVTTYDDYAVGYDYNLSKKTDVYATVGRTYVTAQTAGQTLGAGLRIRF